MRRMLIAGNWKMNGLTGEGTVLAAAIAARAASLGAHAPEIAVFPPATLIAPVAAMLGGGRIAWGGQDCHAAPSGAHTGDIAAAMLADLGCRYVILGHSERRQNHAESDALVRAKAEAALAAGLIAIICVGESLAEREGGTTTDVVRRQLAGSLPSVAKAANTVIAYEPVWAIGTGRNASPGQVAEIHGLIRRELVGRIDDPGATRVLYGGSVKPENAAGLLALEDVDGALVGGASLKAGDFMAIVQAALDSRAQKG